MKFTWWACCLCFLCCDCLTLDRSCAPTAAPSVRLYPLARLLTVPVNTSVLLTCEVRYNGAYIVQWYRDNTTLSSIISEESNSILNYTLFVTSEYKNTQIVCVISPHVRNSDAIQSNIIIINAIAEAGLTPNPRVEPLLDDESPAFHLKWSPSFIWGTFPIDYCVVSIIHTNHSDSVHYSNNKVIMAGSTATFNESGIMSLNKSIDDPQRQTCTEMIFMIMAFDAKDHFHNKSVSVTGRYPSDLGNFSESAINTVVASDAFSKKLLVQIQIELPPLCSYQEMSYNISIVNANGSAIFLQTFNHTGSGIVCHDINQDDADGLELNKNYSLKVAARASFADSEPVEICHEFNTKFNSAYETQCKDFLLILLLTVLCFLNLV